MRLFQYVQMELLNWAFELVLISTDGGMPSDGKSDCCRPPLSGAEYNISAGVRWCAV